LRNLMFERTIDQIVQKGLIPEDKGGLLKEIFEGFPFSADLEMKQEFLNTLSQNSVSLEELNREIEEERKKKIKRDKEKTGKSDSDFLVQSVLFEFKSRELPREQQIIFKKIYLHFVKNI